MVTQIFKHFCSTLHLFFNLLIFWVGNTFIKFNIQKLIEGHRVRSLPLLPFSHIVFLSQAPIVTYRQTYINVAIYVYTQTSQLDYYNKVQIHWIFFICKWPKFISPSSGGWKSELRVPEWLGSSEGPLLGCRLQTSHIFKLASLL